MRVVEPGSVAWDYKLEYQERYRREGRGRIVYLLGLENENEKEKN